jgi:hypothetical protein
MIVELVPFPVASAVAVTDGCVVGGPAVAVRVGLGVIVALGETVHAAPAVAQQFISMAYPAREVAFAAAHKIRVA